MRKLSLALLSAVLAVVALPVVAAYEVPYMTSGSDTVRQGFVRVVNRDAGAGTVSITAIDDAGRRHGPATLSIGGGATVHFNSQDLEGGNADKGLPGGVGPGSGDWRLELDSDLDLEVLAYLRTRDGFLTAMHDVVPGENGRHRVPILNPASNERQVSLLRLTNPGTASAAVRITGIDDAGAGGAGAAEATVAAGATRTLTAADLERMGLGDGAGKWRLLVESDRPLRLVNLLRSPTGHLTNLSTAPATAGPDGAGGVVHRVPLMPAAGGHVQGFVRVTNHGDEPGGVTIRAVDDAGMERGTLRLEVGARATAPFNSDDLAEGNAAKGLAGSVTAGDGDWRLELESDLPIEVLAYARTRDGFVTSLHDAAPTVGRDSHVATLNPGSNDRQVSSLRLVNAGGAAAEVAIVAVDDAGGSPGGAVSLVVPAGGAVTHTSLELEEGAGSGLVGGIGDGAGKWRLRVTSRQPVRALSLIRSPTGHLTNLSTATAPPVARVVALAPAVEVPPEMRDVGDVVVRTLGGDGAEVAADGSSSVLVASDEGGTVLLALADEDGGLLDGGAGAVDVGIESTALALAAAASGWRLPRVDRELAAAIRGRAEFADLVELLTGLMAADKNYLDRLYDYPGAVALVRSVGAGAAAARAGSAAGRAGGVATQRARSAPAAPSALDAPPGGRVARSGPVEARERTFYCWSENRVVGAVRWIPWVGDELVSWVPCSPWRWGQPWIWHGDARGLEAYVDGGNVLNLVRDVALNPLSTAVAWGRGYVEVAIAAASEAPFLAVTRAVPEGLRGRLHAVANPGFVNFAMRGHAGADADWLYVPRNLDVVNKLFNSGAAPGAVTGVLEPEVARLRFERHRFDLLSGDDAARTVSWMNALHLGLAAAELVTNVSAARGALRNAGDWVACSRAVAGQLDAAGLGSAAVPRAGDGDAAPLRRLWDFARGPGRTMLDALLKSAGHEACRGVLQSVVKAAVGSAAGAAANMTPAGWALLAFDAATETVPTAAAYFRPGADRVDYHLTWSLGDDEEFPHVSEVERTSGPAARFTHEQGDGFSGVLDASGTVAGDSDALAFEWTVEGAHAGVGERLTHHFGAAGAHRVDLLVTDGNGETGKSSARVEVTDGRPPVIAGVSCVATDDGTVRMRADFGDPDGQVDLVEWRGRARSPLPDATTDGGTTEVELTSSWAWTAVTVVDDRGNRASMACQVRRELGSFRDAMASGGMGPEMVVIPAGRFVMGCINDDGNCRTEEFPVHVVRIERAFAASRYEVTFEEYDRFTQASSAHQNADDRGWGRGRRPVVMVSWHDAKDYVAWLSSETGAHYRLLSEAEWEYAARAGTETKYSWGNDIGTNRANCRGCGSQWDGRRTAPVGSFAPNPFGLHDMHGNVYGWVEDCWNESYEGAPSDGSAWLSGDCSSGVTRGGSYYFDPSEARSAHRLPGCPISYPHDPDRPVPPCSAGRAQQYIDTGFRVARTLAR